MPIDIWSLITGLASVVSLALVIPERYAAWRKWIAPVGWVCAGFALGRITASLGPSVDRAFSDPALIGVLGIIALCLMGLFLIIRTVKADLNVEGFLWIILIVGTMWGISSVVTRYLDSVRPQLRIAELIEFASYKEARGDLAMAAHYLSMVKANTEDVTEQKRIGEKIAELNGRQLAVKSNKQ